MMVRKGFGKSPVHGSGIAGILQRHWRRSDKGIADWGHKRSLWDLLVPMWGGSVPTWNIRVSALPRVKIALLL